MLRAGPTVYSTNTIQPYDDNGKLVSLAYTANLMYKLKDELIKTYEKYLIPDYHISVFFDSTKGL